MTPAPPPAEVHGVARPGISSTVAPQLPQDRDHADAPCGHGSLKMLRKRVAILISGRGSNMAALIAAAQAARLSGRDRARAVEPRRRPPGSRPRAAAGVATAVLDHKPLRQGPRGVRAPRCRRSSIDHAIELVCLGGLHAAVHARWFVQRWHGRMLNIHPSLLPAFPGLDPHGQALRAGVKISGATVHFVIAGNRCRPDRRAGRGAGRARRHRGDARRARARRRAPHLSVGAQNCSPKGAFA